MKLNKLITLNRELRARNLNLTDYALLSYLEDKQDWIPPRELSELLCTSYANIFLIVDKLGPLVHKERGQDARCVFLCLTAEGYTAMDQIRAAIDEGEA